MKAINIWHIFNRNERGGKEADREGRKGERGEGKMGRSL